MKIINMIKKADTVMCIAWVLAIASAFFVLPDKKYIDYIDFKSLGILWGLMIIIQGFKENSVFERIANALFVKVNSSWKLATMLIFICFFSSMIITNDVALITFVPFAIMMLTSCNRSDMLIPVIILQTIAANLGSMLTPIGNPQNLYMYGLSGINLGSFLLIMLPYSIISLLLLGICIFFIPGKTKDISTSDTFSIVSKFGSRTQIIIYTLLFAIAFMTVLRVIPWQVFVITIFIIVGGMDYKILFRADYILLITFVGFFIFTGNMARIDVINSFLKNVIKGREFYISIAASQIISNVPATLLLSGFTDNYKELIMGVNIGGLGTLIASMASLISYKAYTKEYKENTIKYIVVFSLLNILYLFVMILLYIMLKNVL